MSRFRARLTYANVVATLALFIALGGGAYASGLISGSKLKNRSVTGAKLKRDTLGGNEIKESRLGRVPSAADARTLQGQSPSAFLRNACPAGTTRQADFCFETAARPDNYWYNAVQTCGLAGRRLPTPSEAASFEIGSNGVSRPGWADVIFDDGNALLVSQRGGGSGPVVNYVFPSANSLASYRCVINAGSG